MRLLFLTIILSVNHFIFGQTFTDIQTPIEGISEGSVIWGDYDGDGDLDCFVVGTELINLDNTSGLYQNNSGVFTLLDNELKNIATTNTVAAWGDYDNDNDIDLIVDSKIYKNVAGVFTNINANLTSLRQGTVSWGDYDGDNDLDLLMTGINDATYLSLVYRNDNGVFANIEAGLTGIWNGSGKWGDFDNDGDLDILLVGQTRNSGEPNIGKVYTNTRNTFSEAVSFEGIGSGSADWGDYDNDGDLDIVISGTKNTTGSISPYTILYRNDNGTLIDSGLNLPNLVESYVGWTDFDLDGKLDLMLTGENENGNSETQLYRNENGSNFVPLVTNFINVFHGSFDWGDYNGDGLLDLIISGTDNTSGSYFNVKIYKQDLITAPTFSLSKNVIEVSEDFTDDLQISVTPDHNIDANYSISPSTIGFCSISIDSHSGQVTITSLPDRSGVQIFTITATDKSMVSNTASQDFSLSIIAVNDRPQIQELSDNLSVPENSSIEILLNDLVVSDVDSTFPNDFTITLLPGSNYTLSENIVTPNVEFVGQLIVPVRVNDGMSISELFNILITVTAVPEIEGDFISRNFSIYLNPVDNNLAINSEMSVERYQIRIFGLDGKLTYSYSNPIKGETEIIDLSSAQKGIYVLQITSGKEMGMMKFAKR